MIIGTGIDIVELERIEQAMDKQPRFVARILTENEQEKFQALSPKRKVEFLAGRFAAKEAYAKAVGTGIGGDVSFLDVEVLPDEKGKPVMKSPSPHRVHVAISHSGAFAVAQVIIES